MVLTVVESQLSVSISIVSYDSSVVLFVRPSARQTTWSTLERAAVEMELNDFYCIV